VPPEGWDKKEVSFEIHFDPLWKLKLAARKTAREMWAVYREFVDAGFNEEQALVLTVKLTGEEE
jgi:hypothetical protein